MRKDKTKIFCLFISVIILLNIYPHVNKQPEELYNPGITRCSSGYEEVELPPIPSPPKPH